MNNPLVAFMTIARWQWVDNPEYSTFKAFVMRWYSRKVCALSGVRKTLKPSSISRRCIVVLHALAMGPCQAGQCFGAQLGSRFVSVQQNKVGGKLLRLASSNVGLSSQKGPPFTAASRAIWPSWDHSIRKGVLWMVEPEK